MSRVTRQAVDLNPAKRSTTSVQVLTRFDHFSSHWPDNVSGKSGAICVKLYFLQSEHLSPASTSSCQIFRWNQVSVNIVHSLLLSFF